MNDLRGRLDILRLTDQRIQSLLNHRIRERTSYIRGDGFRDRHHDVVHNRSNHIVHNRREYRVENVVNDWSENRRGHLIHDRCDDIVADLLKGWHNERTSHRLGDIHDWFCHRIDEPSDPI